MSMALRVSSVDFPFGIVHILCASGPSTPNGPGGFNRRPYLSRLISSRTPASAPALSHSNSA